MVQCYEKILSKMRAMEANEWMKLEIYENIFLLYDV